MLPGYRGDEQRIERQQISQTKIQQPQQRDVRGNREGHECLENSYEASSQYRRHVA